MTKPSRFLHLPSLIISLAIAWACCAVADTLHVVGYQGEIGTVTPAYGSETTVPEDGTVECSALDATTGATRGTCLGYDLYTLAAGATPSNGPRTLVTSSSDTSFTYSYANTNALVVWHWGAVSNQLTITADTGGTVAPAGTFLASDEAPVLVTATPEEGKAFLKWTGDIPATLQYDNPLRLPATAPRTIQALFAPAVYAAPSATGDGTGSSWDNAATLANAVAAAANGEVVVVSNGTHQLASRLTIEKGIMLRGLTGDWADVIIKGKKDDTVVRVTSDDAVLTALTIRDGCSKDHWDNNGNAGILWNSGGATIANCRLTGNTQSSWNRYGAVRNDGGKLYRCVIDDNASSKNFYGMGLTMSGSAAIADGCIITNNRASTADDGFGTVRLIDGTMRNCIIANNTLGTLENTNPDKASGVHIEKGVLENCLIHANSFSGDIGSAAAVAVRRTGGTVRNCIIGGNMATDGSVTTNWAGTASAFVNCIIEGHSPAMRECLPYDGTVLDFRGNVLRLLPGSRAIDAGTAAATAFASPTLTPDIYNGNRILGGAIDIGPVEHDVRDTAFACTFSADVQIGIAPLDVVLTAHPVMGRLADTTVTYYWDFDGDGVPEPENCGTDKRVIEGAVEFSKRTITLWTTNSLGQSDCFSLDFNGIVTTHYVVKDNPGATYPYWSWQTAAPDIQTAINAAYDGAEVIVSNGVYVPPAKITILQPIHVRSASGNWDDVVIDGANKFTGALVTLNNGGCLSGVTVTRGRVSGEEGGSGILMRGVSCIVSNCHITANSATDSNRSSGTGILMFNGTVRDCLIDKNEGRGPMRGMGVHIDAGLIERCVIVDNYRTWTEKPVNNDWHTGGGLYMDGGTARNCVIARNDCGTFTPITMVEATGVYIRGSSARMYNCIVSGNSHAGNAHNLIYAFYNAAGTGPVIANCVIEGNYSSSDGAENSIGGTRSVFRNCALPEAFTNGTQNATVITAADYALRNDGYPLLPAGSGLVDAGGTFDWTEADTDLYGNPRIGGTAVDIGPVERQSGAFAVSFDTERYDSLGAFSATLTAAVENAGTAPEVVYYWDLDGDGIAEPENSGAGKTSVSVDFTTYGTTPVTLWATNTAAVPAAGAVWTRDFTVAPAVHYVVGNNPDAAPPYATWATAATNIQHAIDIAAPGAEVVLSNGTYMLNTRLDLAKRVTVRGLTGDWNDVILNGKNAGLWATVYIHYGDAVLSGVTVREGFNGSDYWAGGIQLFAGTVTNCRVTACSVNSANRYGTGIRNYGGHLVDSLIDNNYVACGNFTGGGLYQYDAGALTERCVITNNYATSASGTGGIGAYVAAGVLRNSLIGRNRAGTISTLQATGVRQGGGVIENCTIVGNTWSASAASRPYATGFYHTGGYATNCLIADNAIMDGIASNWVSTAASRIAYTCTTPLAPALGEGCVLDNGGSYRVREGILQLPHSSPCIGAGFNQPWMDGASDLYGNRRIVGRRVDIGCTECPDGAGLILQIR
jgi:hypothetical protein